MRLLLFLSCVVPFFASHTTASEPPTFRTPVALALSDDESTFYVANRDSGTVSVVGTATFNRVQAEIDVGGRPSDIANLNDSLIVLDEGRHQVITLRKSGNQMSVSGRVNVARYPVRLVTDPENERIYVTSLWSRTLSAFSLAGVHRSSPQLLKTVELPFEPRELCMSPDGKHLFVASAFEATLAVVSTGSLELISHRSIPGHNIGGLATSQNGRDLLISQQELNPLARTTRDDIHWGNLMANLLVSYRVDELCSSKADSKLRRSVTQLGDPDSAAGDPGKIFVGPDGRVSVLFSGVNELAIDVMSAKPQRITTRNRPIDFIAVGERVRFIANMFDDSISIIEPDKDDPLNAAEEYRLSLGRRPEIDATRQGEIAFFDARLSRDGWMSCHSCHTDGHSNGQLVDNLSDGGFDSLKRVHSLHGVADTEPWAWNGSIKTLDQQVINSIEKTMSGDTPDESLVTGIVEFMATISPPFVPKTNSTNLHSHGRELFESVGCIKCHAPPLYTSPKAYDVGIADEHGTRKFNPPSLLGVGLRRSLLHDGRATSLTEAVAKHKPRLDEDLNKDELNDLVRFLQSLGQEPKAE